MKKKTLMQMLNRNSYSEFTCALALRKEQKFTSQDIRQFLSKAPDSWLYAFLRQYPPSAEEERIIISKRSSVMVDWLQGWWGLCEETERWVFAEQDPELCEKLLNCSGFYPSEGVEKIMLERADLTIFKLWIARFNSLSENGERMLEENGRLSSLKTCYIEQQSS